MGNSADSANAVYQEWTPVNEDYVNANVKEDSVGGITISGGGSTYAFVESESAGVNE